MLNSCSTTAFSILKSDFLESHLDAFIPNMSGGRISSYAWVISSLRCVSSHIVWFSDRGVLVKLDSWLLLWVSLELFSFFFFVAFVLSFLNCFMMVFFIHIFPISLLFVCWFIHIDLVLMLPSVRVNLIININNDAQYKD